MMIGGAHTSMISVFHSFITQWYSNDPQLCSKLKQPFSDILLTNSFGVLGHESTTLTVVADSIHVSGLYAFYKKDKHISRFCKQKTKTENKRPMGHIAHLRKHFKSRNIMLIKRRNNPLSNL